MTVQHALKASFCVARQANVYRQSWHVMVRMTAVTGMMKQKESVVVSDVCVHLLTVLV